MKHDLRAHLLQIASPLAGRLGEIGPFQVEGDFAQRSLQGPSVRGGCYSRRIVWHRPTVLAGGPVPFDLVWSISRDQPALDPKDLDPDERLFALWDCYALPHRQRMAELERLLAEQYRCWFGVDLPPGASAREDIWYTVAVGVVWVGRCELRGEIHHGLQVELKTDWNDRYGDTPGFVWEEATSHFIPPSPEP
jgi:hypothetical protein